MALPEVDLKVRIDNSAFDVCLRCPGCRERNTRKLVSFALGGIVVITKRFRVKTNNRSKRRFACPDMTQNIVFHEDAVRVTSITWYDYHSMFLQRS